MLLRIRGMIFLLCGWKIRLLRNDFTKSVVEKYAIIFNIQQNIARVLKKVETLLKTLLLSGLHKYYSGMIW